MLGVLVFLLQTLACTEVLASCGISGNQAQLSNPEPGTQQLPDPAEASARSPRTSAEQDFRLNPSNSWIIIIL